MKRSGLRNRFPPEVRTVWLYHYSCHVCGRNSIDTFHHIISPSSRFYVDGKHNESVLNSAPIHNYTHPSATMLASCGEEGFGVTKACHIGNDGWLFAEENMRMLLKKTLAAIEEMEYALKPIDDEFFMVYAHLYA